MDSLYPRFRQNKDQLEEVPGFKLKAMVLGMLKKLNFKFLIQSFS